MYFNAFLAKTLLLMGSGEWGVGSGEWGMGNGEWGMGNGEWGLGRVFKLVVSYKIGDRYFCNHEPRGLKPRTVV